MAVFHFRLEPLLRLREQQRDQRREQLAEALAAEDHLLRQKEQLVLEQGRLRERLKTLTERGELDVDSVLAWRRYEMILAAQQNYLEKQIGMLREEIERRREALLEANRDVRILEILRDKQREDFRKVQEKKTIKTIDEIAGRRQRAEEAL